MLNAIIVDDELNSRELLTNLISKYTTDVCIVGKADSVETGIDLINRTQPDVVFLDIEMPGGDAFDLLCKFNEARFLTCIVSGYDKYALKAIKFGAFDYILKPIEISELQQCVKKARDFLNHNRKKEEKLILHEADNYWVIYTNDIICIEASDNYTILFLDNDRQIISARTLTYFETVLPSRQFTRIHKSHIINMAKIVSIQEGRAPVTVMECGRELSVATRRKKAFYDQLHAFQR